MTPQQLVLMGRAPWWASDWVVWWPRWDELAKVTVMALHRYGPIVGPRVDISVARGEDERLIAILGDRIDLLRKPMRHEIVLWCGGVWTDCY